MSTTTTTATAPKPAEAPRPAQAHAQGRQSGEKPAEADLFASLLSLVSDTHLDAAAADPANAAADTDLPADGDPGTQNPLAALLAWNAIPGTLAPAAAATGTAATAPGTPSPAPKPEAQPAAGNGGVDITGMTPVDEGPASHPPARPAFATAPNRAATPVARTGESGSTATVWQRAGSTDALQQQHAARAAQSSLPQALPVRSTVALDERFSLPSATAGAAVLASAQREAGGAEGLATTASLTGGARPGPDGAPGSGLPAASGVAGGETSGGGDAASDTTGDNAPPEDPAARGGAAEAEGGEGPTVTHWGTQHLRHASLRVGEAGADAIDIQLSMKGQEVQVAFQSDSAEARASLREGASEALAELLQRSGIQLGGVSVGAQGQSHGQQHAASSHVSTVSRGEAAGPQAPSTDMPASLPRADGSRPLDLFV